MAEKWPEDERFRRFAARIAALDALPQKRLVKNELESGSEVCALGALGRARGIDLDELDTLDYEQLGETFDISHQLAQETMFINDERLYRATPEARWRIVRDWAEENLNTRGTGATPGEETER